MIIFPKNIPVIHYLTISALLICNEVKSTLNTDMWTANTTKCERRHHNIWIQIALRNFLKLKTDGYLWNNEFSNSIKNYKVLEDKAT